MKTPLVHLEPQLLRNGLRRVLVRGVEPVMVLAKPNALKFMALSGGRLLVTWEHELRGPNVPQYYLLPPLIVSFLSSDLARDLKQITFTTAPSGLVRMAVTDAYTTQELRWNSDPGLFPSPAEFPFMMAQPRHLIDVGYLDMNDAAHRAVAKLLSMESSEATPRNKLAILVDFSPSRLSIDGQPVDLGVKGRFYFDPRLIIRALDAIHANAVRVGLTRISENNRAVLAFLAQEGAWRVHCALLSIGVDTQKLYPLSERELALA